jgi:hypothetical protein
MARAVSPLAAANALSEPHRGEQPRGSLSNFVADDQEERGESDARQRTAARWQSRRGRFDTDVLEHDSRLRR